MMYDGVASIECQTEQQQITEASIFVRCLANPVSAVRRILHGLPCPMRKLGKSVEIIESDGLGVGSYR